MHVFLYTLTTEVLSVIRVTDKGHIHACIFACMECLTQNHANTHTLMLLHSIKSSSTPELSYQYILSCLSLLLISHRLTFSTNTRNAHKQQPWEQWGVSKPFICMYIMYSGKDAETKRTNLRTHRQKCLLLHTHTHTQKKPNKLRHASQSPSVDQNSFLSAFPPANQYPRWSTDRLKCAREAPQPSHPPNKHTHRHTHTYACWCVMASAASLLTPHMLTGAYTSLLATLTVWNPTERHSDKLDKDRAEMDGKTKKAQWRDKREGCHLDKQSERQVDWETRKSVKRAALNTARKAKTWIEILIRKAVEIPLLFLLEEERYSICKGAREGTHYLTVTGCHCHSKQALLDCTINFFLWGLSIPLFYSEPFYWNWLNVFRVLC